MTEKDNLQRVAQIDKPEGVYTLVYGAHNKRTNLELLPPTLDAIVIEWPSYTGSKPPGYFSELGRLFLPQFSTVLDYAKDRQLPIYHTDLGLGFLANFEIFLPGRPSTWFRNVVMAHKGEWLMRNVTGMKHFAMVLGEGHTGIEGQLRRSPEDRIKALQRLSLILKALSRRETIFNISRYDYNGSEWQLGGMFEVPELKAI